MYASIPNPHIWKLAPTCWRKCYGGRGSRLAEVTGDAVLVAQEALAPALRVGNILCQRAARVKRQPAGGLIGLGYPFRMVRSRFAVGSGNGTAK